MGGQLGGKRIISIAVFFKNFFLICAREKIEKMKESKGDIPLRIRRPIGTTVNRA